MGQKETDKLAHASWELEVYLWLNSKGCIWELSPGEGPGVEIEFFGKKVQNEHLNRTKWQCA